MDGKPVDEGIDICQLCRKRVSAKYGNTSNLFSYLKTSHAAAHKEATDAKEVKDDSSKQPSQVRHILPVGQLTLGEAMAHSQPYNQKGKKLTS